MALTPRQHEKPKWKSFGTGALAENWPKRGEEPEQNQWAIIRKIAQNGLLD
jgi:hypothetical protein